MVAGLVVMLLLVGYLIYADIRDDIRAHRKK